MNGPNFCQRNAQRHFLPVAVELLQQIGRFANDLPHLGWLDRAEVANFHEVMESGWPAGPLQRVQDLPATMWAVLGTADDVGVVFITAGDVPKDRQSHSYEGWDIPPRC
jgi:hypothetical protein